MRSGRSNSHDISIGDGKNQPKSVGVYRAPSTKDSVIKGGARSPIPKDQGVEKDPGTL